MLTNLDFEVAGGVAKEAAGRADVACFVGYVPRRPSAPLLPAERAYLRSRGWIDGPWNLGAARIEGLLHVPVIVESWGAFDRLFGWEDRILSEGGEPRCTSYLGAAVRSFFAQGGRRAVVVRTGDPWPYLGGDDRASQRSGRLGALVPSVAVGSRPFDATDPSTWRGIEHLYGLREVSHVCLPDLADACALEPPALPVVTSPPSAPEVFVECSDPEPAGPPDQPLRFVSAPRLDPAGFGVWAGAVDDVRGFLAAHRRDALLLASLPLPDEGAPGGAESRTEWLGFLRQNGVLEREDRTVEGTAASALVQLAWPWLRTTRSDDVPERLEPAEGLLAGVLAVNALGRGTFRSVAGTRLPQVVAVEPVPDLGLGPDSPTARLAQRVCLIGNEPDGIYLLSDVTSTPDRAWRPGGVSRLMAVVLRAARRTGEAELFEANGPETWRRIRGSMEALLDGFFQAGALRAADRLPAYEVRCDRTTMSQNDLDHGRVRVEITVQPSAPVERITVALALAGGGSSAVLPEVA